MAPKCIPLTTGDICPSGKPHETRSSKRDDLFKMTAGNTDTADPSPLIHLQLNEIRHFVNILLTYLLSKGVRERLGIDYIILILQQNRLRWYGHVLQKEDTDWVKKCMEYEVEGSRPIGRPKRTWKEVVQKDCQARNLNKEDAMDRGRWKKLIKIG